METVNDESGSRVQSRELGEWPGNRDRRQRFIAPIGIEFHGAGIHGVEIGFPVLLHCFLRILTGGEMPHAREAKSNRGKDRGLY